MPVKRDTRYDGKDTIHTFYYEGYTLVVRHMAKTDKFELTVSDGTWFLIESYRMTREQLSIVLTLLKRLWRDNRENTI